MKDKIEAVTAGIAQAIRGEAPPPFQSREFTDLVGAASAIAAGDGGPFTQAVYASIGRQTILVLLAHLRAGMTAERTLALMRGDGECEM